MNGNTNPAPMEQEYKIIYRDESGTKGSVSLPSFLIENRKELWRAAFLDATSRMHGELAGTPSEQLEPLAKELSVKHMGYFNEYIDAHTRAKAIVENTELAWASTLDETIVKQLGGGDADVGVSELIIAICLIADDQMEPLIKTYRER